MVYMKKTISGNELSETLSNAVNLMCDAVSSTLGPSGNNVLINTDDGSPFITNDGVTIARAIKSDDVCINTVLEIVKEASLKTNEEVGDGTTTTLVLLQSIFNDSIKAVESGVNPIILKKELNEVLDKVTTEINNLKRKASKEDLVNIACTSSNDREIGIFVSDVFFKMGSSSAIKLSQSKDGNSYYEIKKGYEVSVDNIPSVYFKENETIELENVYIVVIRGYLNNLEDISDIINEGIARDKSLLIFSEDYDSLVEEEVIVYYLQEGKNIFLFKTPDFASRKNDIEEDIAVLTNSQIVNLNFERINWTFVGVSSKVIISKNDVTIINDNLEIKSWIKKIKEKIVNTESDYEKEFLEMRLARLTKGVATIYVGGNTKTEIKEKIMRYEDALCALDRARNGVVYGEGITYLKVAENLGGKLCEKIIREALSKPFQKIMENAGLDYLNIKDEIFKSGYNKIYNFENGIIESVENTRAIDPVDVSIMAFKNAVSIASILFTTRYLIIDETIKTQLSSFIQEQF